MADYKDLPGGRQDAVLSHDEGDGTFSRTVATHLRGWDSTDGAWYRVPVDHATGALLTVASGGAGSGLTDTQLRASAVPVSLSSVPSHAVTNAGTFAVQATLAVETTKVIGTVNVAAGQTIAVTGALTDTQLRATPVPVSGTVTATTGGLTDTQLRATPVPVSGTVSANATLAAETTKVIGTVNVASAQTIAVTQATAASLNATVVQGTAAAVSGGWPVKVTDGTNTQPTGDVVARAIFHKVTDGTTAVKVTVANAQPISTDGALLVNAIDTFAGTALASASRGVATVNTDIVNYNGKGIRVWQDLTVLGASSVCQFSIQEKDPVSGKFVTLLASAATGAGINSTGTAKLTVYPGLTAAANVTASDVVPVNIRIVSTVATAASTFSQGYSIIP